MGEGKDSPKVQKAFKKVEEIDKDLSKDVQSLKNEFLSRSSSSQKLGEKNTVLAAGVGLPGLVGLSYAYEDAKRKNK